jgi:hypothetical protein
VRRHRRRLDALTSYDEIEAHYERHWGPSFDEIQWPGAMASLDPEFRILVFAPRDGRAHWTYATCGMCVGPARPVLETHLFIDSRDDRACVEVLTHLAYFHQTGEPLGLHHTVAFGNPWIPGSALAFGFLSLPYLDGPDLEWQRIRRGDVRHLWLLPITAAERELKKTSGVETLEQLFDERGPQYANPMRASVV